MVIKWQGDDSWFGDHPPQPPNPAQVDADLCCYELAAISEQEQKTAVPNQHGFPSDLCVSGSNDRTSRYMSEEGYQCAPVGTQQDQHIKYFLFNEKNASKTLSPGGR